jgi:PAS domain S-box-containing protein
MESNNKADHSQLRKKAEEMLVQKLSKISMPPNDVELLRLVHELEVHQIELELQNEELKFAREESERIAHKYTYLYDFAPIGYFTLSKEGKILELNLTGSKMLGKERSYLINKSFGRYIPENDVPEFNKFLESAFKSEIKKATDMVVLGISNPPIYAQLTAIVDEEREDHCLLTVMDITDRKKAKLELEEVNKQLNILNAQKDKFFSIIAHDLKNPFNSIMGYSELIVMEVQEKNYQAVEEYAGIILSSSARALDLLGNLMEWAKSQTGRIIYNPTRIFLADVVDEVVELFDQIASQKDINIQKNIPSEIEISADKDMISTVVRNLVSNAIKFTEQGGEISIFTKENSNSFTLCIKDLGVGIPDGVLEKLFKFDANYTTLGTRNEKGSGLGLILCKEFIDKHKGRIWAESERDLGSTFYVEFPR